MQSRDLFQLVESGSCSPRAIEVRSFVERQRKGGPAVWQRHPLGFFASRAPIDADLELRLHVWPEDWILPIDQAEADLHDHVFELSSLVLLGSIGNETFDITPSSVGQYRILQISYQGTKSGGSELGPERYQLIPKTAETIREGATYRIKSGVVHRGTAIGGPSATLVATRRNPAIKAPRVILRDGVIVPPSFVRSSPTQEEWRSIDKALSPLLQR